MTLAKLDISGKNAQSRYYNITLSTPEKNLYIAANKNRQVSDVKFVGLRDQYFCAIVQPEKDYNNVAVQREGEAATITYNIAPVSIPANSQIGHLYRIYLGPQDLKSINNVQTGFAVIINYGMFDFIAQLLLQLLAFFYGLVHNWGLAIIILSVAVYFLLYPLTLKQMRSMKEMQALQPKIEALKVLYKDNPQRLNKEIMELYRTHKVNPFGGCLPLLLQMPIFFALYQALLRSVALKGAQFLWIKDLSEPDRLPLFGTHVNILPLFMAILMFAQQKISMAATSGSSMSNEQQKMMTFIMPVMFGVIFYNMPAGLVLYWFVNSILMFIYQLKVSRAK